MEDNLSSGMILRAIPRANVKKALIETHRIASEYSNNKDKLMSIIEKSTKALPFNISVKTEISGKCVCIRKAINKLMS